MTIGPDATPSGRLRRQQDHELVIRISSLLNASLDLEKVLELTMREVAEAMNGEAGSVFLVDENSDKLTFYVALGEAGGKIQGMQIDRGVGIVGHVVETGQPIVVPDVSKDTRFFATADKKSGYKTRSVLATPLRVRGRMIGALEVLNKRLGSWSDQDLPLFEALAQQVSLAVDNAQLYTKLNGAYERLQKLDKMKSDFIAVASHELRTPLTSTKLYLELLLDGTFGTPSGEQLDALQTVDKNVSRLVAITNDLTNLSYLSRGEMVLHKEPQDPYTILQEAAREVMGFVRQRDQQIEVVPCPDLPKVAADKERIMNVMQNLLLNAIRFTPDQGRITLRAAPTERTVQFSVNDTGIGVSKEEQHAIFEGLYEVQGHEHHSSGTIEFRSAGMGVGLAIARGIVENHGGRIWVESDGADKGSTFHFTVPQA